MNLSKVMLRKKLDKVDIMFRNLALGIYKPLDKPMTEEEYNLMISKLLSKKKKGMRN